MRKISFLIITLCLLMLSANKNLLAQEATKLSLKEAQEFALKNNTTILNSKIDNEIARKKIWETTAIGLPQVEGSVGYQNIVKVPTASFPMGENGENVEIPLGVKENTTYTLSVSQLIFNGNYIVGLQASKVYYQMSDQTYLKSAIETRESVANTYYLILSLVENKKILSSNLQNLKQTFYEMQQMLAEGFVEATDVDQFQITVSSLENSVNTLDRQAEVAKRLLKFQMGMDLEQQIELTDQLESTLQQVNLASLTEQNFSVEKNIDYQIMLTQEKLGKLNYRKDLSDYLPSIAGFYQHQELAKKSDFNFTPPDVFGFTVSIPIFSSGERWAKAKQSSLALDKIVNAKKEVERSLNLGYIQAKSDLSSAYEKYLTEKNNIELSKKVYDITLIKYKEGVSTSMDLTTAQNQYLTAETNYFSAIYSVLTAKTKFDKILSNL